MTPEADTGSAVTRADLAEAVHRALGLSRAECARLVEATLEEIIAALERGEVVKLTGFGTFHARAKGERMGRNPKTGELVPILPRRSLSFRPAQDVRARVAAAPDAKDMAG
jgi:integration host factor subunit alpha